MKVFNLIPIGVFGFIAVSCLFISGFIGVTSFRNISDWMWPIGIGESFGFGVIGIAALATAFGASKE